MEREEMRRKQLLMKQIQFAEAREVIALGQRYISTLAATDRQSKTA